MAAEDSVTDLEREVIAQAVRLRELLKEARTPTTFSAEWDLAVAVDRMLAAKEPRRVRVKIGCAGQCGLFVETDFVIGAYGIVQTVIAPPGWNEGWFAPWCPDCSARGDAGETAP